jgi:hypothetical protein
MRFILVLCATALAVPALTAAQTAPTPDWPLTPGLRVRVLSPALGNGPKTGSVVAATSDTLIFLPAKQSASTALGASDIARIEVARGTHTRKLQGALLGLFLGAAAGAVISSASYAPPNCAPGVWCMDVFGQGGETVAGGVLGGLLGMLVGTIVGDRKTDTWVPVTVPQPAVAAR